MIEKLSAMTGLVLAAAMLGPRLASAHHSFNMFDMDRDVTYQGVVEQYGWRNPHVHIIVRTLGGDGDVLVVESTWTDPAVFRTPHTYVYRYHKRAPSYEPPFGVYCDAFDPERARFLGGGE